MRIYLDYAATTPVDSSVKKAMEPYFSEKFGNPSSLHFFGQQAMAAIDESREKIAKIISRPPAGGFREIIFTGSATEANNLALRGVVKGARCQMLNVKCPRLIVSAIEHESILETCRDLEKEGIEVVYLPVNREGIVDLKKLKEALNERTILVSIMYANNEIGTIQPITEITKVISEFRIKNLEFRKKNNSKFLIHNSELATALPLLHTDAVQAFQYLDCDVNKLGVDLMTLSAHKIYGPKGIGVLYARALYPNPHTLNPIITGGGQEFGFRSGTENVPAIVGFAKAAELVIENRGKEIKRISELADYFWQKIKKICSKAELNGIINYKSGIKNKNKNKIPNILNIYFPKSAGWRTAEDFLIGLDLAGIAVSSGSACSVRSSEPSHVLKACGLPENRIKSSLRFSLGKFTTKMEIDEAIKRIAPIV